jgi:hypothetical protein
VATAWICVNNVEISGIETGYIAKMGVWTDVTKKVYDCKIKFSGFLKAWYLPTG